MTAPVRGGDRRNRVAAAILAGGRGRRLGEVDKASLLIENKSILARQLEVLTPLFSRVLLVGNREAPPPPGVVPVTDRVPPGAGPLAGLEAALNALVPQERAVVCVAADMPFLQSGALRLLRDEAPLTAAVVPRVAGHPEPLFARYPRTALGAVTRALAENRLKMAALLTELEISWLEESTLRVVDPDLRALENINEPADLERARAHLQRRDPSP